MRRVSLAALLLGIAVFISDFLTKAAVALFIPPMGYNSHWYPYNGIGVFQDFFGIEFSIVHLTNKGAAWGWLSEFQIPLLAFRIVLITLLTGYVLFFNRERSRVLPFTLIIAGALGNVLDYFIYGHVVDMFRFIFWGYDYPAFNVADSAIFIGIAWLCLSSCFCEQRKNRKFELPSKS